MRLFVTKQNSFIFLVMSFGFFIGALLNVNWGNLVKAQTSSAVYNEIWQATEFYVSSVYNYTDRNGGNLYSIYEKRSNPAGGVTLDPSKNTGVAGNAVVWDSPSNSARSYSVSPDGFVSRWVVFGQIQQ